MFNTVSYKLETLYFQQNHNSRHEVKEKILPKINFRCSDEFEKYIFDVMDITGMNKTEVILGLCNDGKVNGNTKQAKKQTEIIYILTAILHEVIFIRSSINQDKKIDILVLNSLCEIEEIVREIRNDMSGI